MIPVLDKNNIRIITQALNPEQTEYVAGVAEIMNDTTIAETDKSDILYITKIMAFADKFKNLHWAAETNSYHKVLDEFWESLEEYKDAVAENIQSIIGQFKSDEIIELKLPVGNDPLVIINELKDCVNDWLELHKEDIEYEGCRNATSGFLEDVHKYIYLFRLCKNGN